MKNLAKYLHNKRMFIIFVVSIKPKGMKKPSKEQKEFEAELIYYLRLFNELKGREGARKILNSIEKEINRLVETLKEL